MKNVWMVVLWVFVAMGCDRSGPAPEVETPTSEVRVAELPEESDEVAEEREEQRVIETTYFVEESAEVPPRFAEVPDELGGVTLGELRPADLIDEPIRRDVEVQGLVGSLYTAVSHEGRVTHVMFLAQKLAATGNFIRSLDEEDYYGDEDDHEYQDEATEERESRGVIMTALQELLGTPTTLDGSGEDLIEEWHGEGRRLQFIRVQGIEYFSVVVLRTEDPSRPCGPEDGIQEWHQGLVRAIRENDGEALSGYFHFPFVDDRYGEDGLSFATEEEFIARFESLKEDGVFDSLENAWRVDCDIYDFLLAGKSERSIEWDRPVGGVLRIQRIDGEWRGVRVDGILN
jgi:hypothetical protein